LHKDKGTRAVRPPPTLNTKMNVAVVKNNLCDAPSPQEVAIHNTITACVLL